MNPQGLILLDESVKSELLISSDLRRVLRFKVFPACVAVRVCRDRRQCDVIEVYQRHTLRMEMFAASSVRICRDRRRCDVLEVYQRHTLREEIYVASSSGTSLMPLKG